MAPPAALTIAVRMIAMPAATSQPRRAAPMLKPPNSSRWRSLAVATVALAFGLGGRDVARELSAGRFLRTAYSEGQVISVGEVRGEIVAMETAMTVLRTSAGETVRVPNNMLLNSVVRVHGADAQPTA